jgi:sugar phosphate isomerase/epimerase
MKLGLLTVVYEDLPVEEALDRIVELGFDAVELGTGNYPGNAHCDPDRLLADPRLLRELRKAVDARGLELTALSCHGNPLHPDLSLAEAANATWQQTVRLAEELEVPVVNTFSGCPGDRSGGVTPNWVTCPWPPEYAELLEWQWTEVAIPYWAEQTEFASRHGVERIGLEMHPGFLVYNPETLLRLRREVGPAIGANFDPSHLIWQGIDVPAAIDTLGSVEAIFHAHAKDTYVNPRNVRANGVIDTKGYEQVARRAWTFRSVGDGQGERAWREVVAALRTAGYDYVLSIEHEDPLASRDEGLTRAADLLKRIVLREQPGELWWTVDKAKEEQR